jgi:hypothetical protein
MKQIIFRRICRSIFSVIFAGACLVSLSARANFYLYTQVALKDMDDMNKIVFLKIKEAKKDKVSVATEPLKEALQAVFSRSNEDFLIEKILSPLKNELDDAAAWESTVNSLIDDAIAALQNPDKHKPNFQVTYAILLENFLQEFKPKVTGKEKSKFELDVVTRIRVKDV